MGIQLHQHVLTPDTKSTPSRTGAYIVVCAEPRCISQKHGCVKSTDAEVASSPHFSLTPHCLYSLTYPATAAQLYLRLYISSEMSIISQRLPESYTSNTVFRRQLLQWRCFKGEECSPLATSNQGFLLSPCQEELLLLLSVWPLETSFAGDGQKEEVGKSLFSHIPTESMN